MGLRDFLRKGNEGSALSVYAQSSAQDIMTRVAPSAAAASPKLPNAIRTVEERKPVEMVPPSATAKAESVIMTKTLSPQDIACRAWDIWTREGRPAGRALDHWLQAESELRS